MMEKQQRENNRWGSEIQDYWMEVIDSKKIPKMVCIS